MSNDFERKYTLFANNLKKKNAQNVEESTGTKAADIYADKPFSIEYATLFTVAKVGAFIAQIVTFLTTCALGVFALVHVIPFSWGVYIAVPLALLFAFGVEKVKRSTTEKAAKFYLKYNVLGGVGAVAIAVALVSVCAALLGAKELPAIVYPAAQISTDTTQINALKTDLAQVQKDIDRTAKKLENTDNWQAENRTLPRLQKERARLSSDLNSATIQATEQQKLDLLQSEYDRAAKVAKMQVYSISAAIIAELIFILCTLFILYYYFRQYAEIETEKEGENSEITAKKTFLASQNLNAERTLYATIPQVKGTPGTLNGTCLHCKKVFTKNTTRHKFCGEKCRIESWEEKNGKTLKKHK